MEAETVADVAAIDDADGVPTVRAAFAACVLKGATTTNNESIKEAESHLGMRDNKLSRIQSATTRPIRTNDPRSMTRVDRLNFITHGVHPIGEEGLTHNGMSVDGEEFYNVLLKFVFES